MSPRPRTLSDADILAATGKAIFRLGPAKLTLSQIAREAGLSAATLVQRFGSKKGLLLAMFTAASDSVDACFEAVRAKYRSPLAALVAAATEMTRYIETPEEMANHLAFLQMDLADPDFHRLTLEHSTRVNAGYRALLDDAVAAGELATCDTPRLARAVGSMSFGSLSAWAVHREGTAEAWVRRDLETLLQPHRITVRRGRKRANPTTTSARGLATHRLNPSRGSAR
jgi:AcrR family transcriptional regulator